MAKSLLLGQQIEALDRIPLPAQADETFDGIIPPIIHEDMFNQDVKKTNEDGMANFSTLALVGIGSLLAGAMLTPSSPYTLDQKSSQVRGNITKIEPVAFACRAVIDADLVAHQRNKLVVAGKMISGTGYEASLDGKAQQMVCMDNPVVEVSVDNKTKRQLVTIQLSSLKFYTRYIYPDTKVTQETPSISAIGEGISSLVHGVSSALTGGLSDKILENEIQKQQQMIESDILQQGVRTLQTDCADKSWKIIQETIAQSYVLEAKKLHIKPTDIDLRFVGQHPDWNKLYEDSHKAEIRKIHGRSSHLKAENHIKNTSCTVSPHVTAPKLEVPVTSLGATNG